REEGSYGYVILFSREFYYYDIQNKEVLPELTSLINSSSHPCVNLDLKEYEAAFSIAKDMFNEFKSDGLLRGELLRSYLNIVLIYCKRHFRKENTEEDPVGGLCIV
ncbi:MAG: hypothetical protein M3Q97_08930, partial [Bacteroidota bacterium]|nr:hypothetical protein [Bacteroidota bacterium]